MTLSQLDLLVAAIVIGGVVMFFAVVVLANVQGEQRKQLRKLHAAIEALKVRCNALRADVELRDMIGAGDEYLEREQVRSHGP